LVGYLEAIIKVLLDLSTEPTYPTAAVREDKPLNSLSLETMREWTLIPLGNMSIKALRKVG
jgi:hypothetical protein